MVRQVFLARSSERRKMKGKRKDPEQEGAGAVWPPVDCRNLSHRLRCP